MKRRKKLYSQKRTTFRALLLRGLAAVLVLTALFAVCFQAYLTRDVFSGAVEAVSDVRGTIRVQMESTRAQNPDRTDVWLRMDRWNVAVRSEMFFVQPGTGLKLFEVPELCPNTSRNCHSSIVLVDDTGKVVASNRPLLTANFVYPEYDWELLADDGSVQYADKLFLCDPEALQNPEVDRLFARYLELEQDTDDMYYHVTGIFTSAYVNRETHSFIPHQGVLRRESWTRDEFLSNQYRDNYIVPSYEEYPVELNVELPGYELVELHQQVNMSYDYDEASGESVPDLERYQREQQYPYQWNNEMLFFGESSEVLQEFEQLEAFLPESGDETNYTDNVIPGDSRVVARSTDYFAVGAEHYTLHVRMMLDYKDPILVEYYWKCVCLFAGIVTLLALLLCWRKNVRNQARYAMQDYQRGLTDTLAHDIKTPLMAISGYAENIRDGNLPEEKQKKFVSGILDNVAYTDDLISRTLFLNHMEQGKKGKPEAVRLAPLAEKLLTKYDLMLREKKIRAGVSGSAEVQADPSAMETILENMISNAVKYTPEGGKLQVTMDQKTLTVTNSVAQKISVKKLKEPFYRGDAARSNVKGNGLGLAIADRAANANGFKLKLSCTDTEFRAELKF